MKTHAARPIKAEKHLWYEYNGRKKITLRGKDGTSVVLEKGSIFGIHNINNRTDRLVTPSGARLLLPVETTGDLLDASKRYRQEVKFAEPPPKPAKPKRIRFPIEAPEKKTPAKEPKLANTRIEAIKQAVKKTKTPTPVAPKKKRETFDLDDDTFLEYDNLDLHDLL